MTKFVVQHDIKSAVTTNYHLAQPSWQWHTLTHIRQWGEIVGIGVLFAWGQENSIFFKWPAYVVNYFPSPHTLRFWLFVYKVWDQGNCFLEHKGINGRHIMPFWEEPLQHSWLVTDYSDHCSCHSFMLLTVTALYVNISCGCNYFTHCVCITLHDCRACCFSAGLHWCS